MAWTSGKSGYNIDRHYRLMKTAIFDHTCRAGRTLCSAVEDDRAAPDQTELTCAIRNSVGESDANLPSNIYKYVYIYTGCA